MCMCLWSLSTLRGVRGFQVVESNARAPQQPCSVSPAIQTVTVRGQRGVPSSSSARKDVPRTASMTELEDSSSEDDFNEEGIENRRARQNVLDDPVVTATRTVQKGGKCAQGRAGEEVRHVGKGRKGSRAAAH
jgi:hypothetical protein